jgi:hypothetical protein
MSLYEVVPENLECFSVVYDGWLTVRGFSSKKAAKKFVQKLEHGDFYDVR